MKMTGLLVRLAVLMILLMADCVTVAEISGAPSDRVRWDSRGLIIEGKRVFIFSGAFHYFRVPKSEWLDRFEKMKAAGFNCVETYVPWNWHEQQPPASVDDFSNLNLQDLEDWMAMAHRAGLYTIIRPGPYICAEWAGGGLPQWLVALNKPANPLRKEMWLQTDDPVYLAWVKHWFAAVTRVVAPQQITRKKPGEPGVILFQIENEYERLKLPRQVKVNQLEALAGYSREGGIDVPLVTYWTSQTRNVNVGPLSGILDFVNQYPKWEVAKKIDSATAKQVKDQPSAPLMTMELQGGWYSEVGGKLSGDIDGISPVQTQTLTLYMLQKGYSLINYYMLVGGTNFDDWASRQTTATYDFGAAIGEGGLIGERYARLAAIGQMLREHGTALLESDTVELKSEVSDPAVSVAARQTREGDRYLFVRTEGQAITLLPNEFCSSRKSVKSILPLPSRSAREL